MWRLKILTKLMLARLPVPYAVWKRVGIFRHGAMDRAAYALGVFEKHEKRSFPKGLPAGFTFLELGPGDSLLSMLIAAGKGASRIWLIDHAVFAETNPEFYRTQASRLRERGVAVPDISGTKTLADILTICRAEYLTDGVRSLQTLPAGSIDFLYSQAVLEHIYRDEFPALAAEMRRVLKPSGVASHTIDFQDHMAHALNHLRFPPAVWESRLFRTSGFYTNRLLRRDIAHIFQSSGFEIKESALEQWPHLPTPRAALHAAYRDVPEPELLIKGIGMVLNPVSKKE